VKAIFPSAITGWERFIFLNLLNACKTFISNVEEKFVCKWTLATKAGVFGERQSFSLISGLLALLPY
jgi:hypothetical protein